MNYNVKIEELQAEVAAQNVRISQLEAVLALAPAIIPTEPAAKAAE